MRPVLIREGGCFLQKKGKFHSLTLHEFSKAHKPHQYEPPNPLYIHVLRLITWRWIWLPYLTHYCRPLTTITLLATNRIHLYSTFPFLLTTVPILLSPLIPLPKGTLLHNPRCINSLSSLFMLSQAARSSWFGNYAYSSFSLGTSVLAVLWGVKK